MSRKILAPMLQSSCLHEFNVGVDESCVVFLRKTEPDYERILCRCEKCGTEAEVKIRWFSQAIDVHGLMSGGVPQAEGP